jgi:hypothetical protein
MRIYQLAHIKNTSPLTNNKARSRNSLCGLFNSVMPWMISRRKMWKNEQALFAMILAFLMTFLGSLAQYSYKVLNGDPFNWRTLCLQMIVSIFAGVMMMLLSVHYGWSATVTGGVCGLAGWSGSTLIKTLENKIIKKIEDE